MAYARDYGPANVTAPQRDPSTPEWAVDGRDRTMPDLKFAATVVLVLESSKNVGKTPDGVRLELRVHGEVAGPMLNGNFPSLAAHMLVDVSGIGTLAVRAPLQLSDGAVLEIEATVRYDFGEDGYEKAAKDQLPDSHVAGALRFLTADPRYLWVNRALCLGVGALYSKEKQIAYDLLIIGAKPLPGDASTTASYRSTAAPYGSPAGAAPYGSPAGASLYDRLGGNAGLRRIVADFFQGLTSNPQLLHQNPQIAVAYAKADPEKRDKRFADYLGVLAGGPGEYTGQPLDRVHAPMGITEADWTLGAQEIVRALNKNRVSKADQNELFALVEPLKPQIVQGHR